uniref:non-specific serine/threonine protein kinase n=1 Tax=Coccolithus braarudii TaxID=221442 RepID=A0A7S0Q8E9_9EUKA|mmetsp:Transcript_5284/g.11600  ORF Transcript_5284/g.11600 Transcript_5284/m.11600 type:complete len:522 (+) Transcript_5284:176-1741(+)
MSSHAPGQSPPAAPAATSASQSFMSKSGWLTKQGHIFKTWKKRWFVLEGEKLKYYKTDDRDQGSFPPTILEQKGTITLTNCGVANLAPSEADSRQHAFQISPLSKKIFLICAENDSSRTEWMKAIEQNSQGTATPSQLDATEANDPDPSEVKNVANGGDEGISLSDFELLKVIGRGTYGKVMQVRLKDSGEIFAMKVLKKENIFARGDPKDLQHTIAERNVLALLNSHMHPFILGLKFAFHTPAKLYYVLNFCNGGDLYYLLSRCKKFKEPQARFYAGEVFLAIEHLHSLGVIYRDLKPENVLLDSDGHVKLTDFGLSKESQTADTFCGTPVYLAPEIWQRKAYGFEVDWWSLGCVLYEMVVGLPPFWGDTIKDVYKKVLNTQPKFPMMTSDCQSLIEGMLKHDTAKRLGAKTADSGGIREHPFFASQAWDDLLAKRVKPPFRSKASSQEDTNNFHKAFTNQRPIDSMANPGLLSDEQQTHFDGFTYVPTSSGDLASASSNLQDMRITDAGRPSYYTQPPS